MDGRIRIYGNFIAEKFIPELRERSPMSLTGDWEEQSYLVLASLAMVTLHGKGEGQ